MTRTYRWARRAVWGTFAVVLTIGCNPLTTIGVPHAQGRSRPAKYPLVRQGGAEEGQGRGRSSRCSSARAAARARVRRGRGRRRVGDGQAACPRWRRRTSRRSSVDPARQGEQVQDREPELEGHARQRLGQEARRRFVLEIHLDKMSLYQPGSLNQLYEGRAEVDGRSCTTWTPGAAEPKSLRRTRSPTRRPAFRDATAMPVPHVPQGVPRTAGGRTCPAAHRPQAEQRHRRGAGRQEIRGQEIRRQDDGRPACGVALPRFVACGHCG